MSGFEKKSQQKLTGTAAMSVGLSTLASPFVPFLILEDYKNGTMKMYEPLQILSVNVRL